VPPRHAAPSHGRVDTDQEGRPSGNETAPAVLLSAVGLRRSRGRHRRRRRRRGPLTIALLICVICAVVASAVLLGRSSTKHTRVPTTNTPVSATNTPGIAGDTKTLFIDLDGTSYNWGNVAPAYQALILNDWDTSWITEIKAASRGTQVFVYKDLSSTRSDDCTGNQDGSDSCISGGVFCPAGTNDSSTLSAGVGFCWAWRNHPSWFLRDSSGALITETGYRTQYMMDFGNPAYQAQWLANVKSDALTSHWDGVFMDNVMDNTNYGTPASYPKPADIQAAMLSMLKVVGPGLSAAGITNIGNLGYNNLYPTLWPTWLPYVSGFMNEFSYYWPDKSPEGAEDWSRFLEPEVRACTSQEKICIFNVGNSTLTKAQIDFATASILLYADGNSYISFGDGNGNVDRDPHVTLGAATDSACESDGIWHRNFASGSISVNPVAGDVGHDASDCSEPAR
jgi:Hypothetical glycosyl hydrolase family 15